MNWIKQNKFLTGFFAFLAVGIAALGYLLFSAMTAAEEATNLYTETSTELARLQNLPLSATKQNLDALVAQKKDAVQSIEAFQSTLAKKTFPLEPMSPEQFQDKLKATRNSVTEKSVGSTKLPDKFFLGFDPYETRPPDPTAAAPLGRELKAIEWIFSQVIESHITEVKTIKRDLLPEESGGKAAASSAPAERGPAAGPGGRKGKPLVTTATLELTFQARQSALSAFVNALVGPKAPQFYALRSLRVKNQNEKGPPRVDPNAPLVAGAEPAVEGAAAVPKPVSSYIVGEEQLEVTLLIEITNFAEPEAATAAK